MELAMRWQSFLPSFMIELRPTQAGGQGDPTFRFRAPAYQHGNSPGIIATMMPVVVIAI